MKFGVQREEEEVGIQMAPMIDIVFQLLIFFMVVSGIIRTEAELAARLPALPDKEKTPRVVDMTIINVLADERIVVNRRTFGLPGDRELFELRQMLSGLSALSKEQVVIIKSEKQARYERVIDVLNACTGANVRNVVFGGSGKKKSIKMRW